MATGGAGRCGARLPGLLVSSSAAAKDFSWVLQTPISKSTISPLRESLIFFSSYNIHLFGAEEPTSTTSSCTSPNTGPSPQDPGTTSTADFTPHPTSGLAVRGSPSAAFATWT